MKTDELIKKVENLRPITDKEIIVGKTIANCRFIFDGTFGITFTDGDFILLGTIKSYEQDAEISILNKCNIYHFRELGLITSEEYVCLYDIQIKKEEYQREEMEYARYKVLKLKFEEKGGKER